MKHIIIALVTLFALTSCFSGEKQEVDDGWVTVPDVVVEDAWEVDESEEQSQSNDADGKDDVSLGDVNDSEDTNIGGDEESSEQDSQETQEVLNEFEDDLDDIFKDLGL